MRTERPSSEEVKREPSTQQPVGPAAAAMVSNPTSTSLQSGETQQAGGQRASSSRYRTAESREKNRQAQQRFRDRQKAVLEGREAQAASIRAEAERVRRANLQLAESARIKEKVLAVRESMLSALEPAPQPPPQQPFPWQAAAAAGLLPALQQQQAQQQAQQQWQWQAAAAAAALQQQQQQQQQQPGALLGQLPPLPQLQFPQQQGGWAGEQQRGAGGGAGGGLQYYPALQAVQQPRAQLQLPQVPSALELMLQQAWQEQAALAEGLLQQCQAAGAAAAGGLAAPPLGAAGAAALPALSSTAPGALAAAAAAAAAAGISTQSLPVSVGTLPSLPERVGGYGYGGEGRLQEGEHSPQRQQQQQRQEPEQMARAAGGSVAEGSVAGGQAGAGAGGEWGAAAAASPADEVLEEAQAIQLPEFDDPVRREVVEGMRCPEDFIEAWRVWQVELCHSLSEAEERGFQGEQMRKLEDIVDHMVILFWYASRLKPGFAEACMVKGAAPPEVAEALYRRVASRIQLSPAQRAKLLKQWNLCSKRLAQAEVSLRRWSSVLHAEHEKAADAAAATGGVGGAEGTRGAASAAGVAAALAAVVKADPGRWQQQQERGGLSGAAAAAAEAAAAMASAEVIMTDASEDGAGAAGGGGGGGGGGAKGMLGSGSRGMVASAKSSLAVTEATAKLAQACTAKDLAVKDFLGKLNWVFSAENKARINVLSAPYFPDFLSISRYLLFPEGGPGGEACLSPMGQPSPNGVAG